MLDPALRSRLGIGDDIELPAGKTEPVIAIDEAAAKPGRTRGDEALRIAEVLHPQATSDEESLAFARGIYDQLRLGRIDRSRFTEDANYYFTDQVLSDYRDSLGPLGDPQSFTATGPARLRGGFVNRNYRLSFAGRQLTIVTYAEPGARGRFEQYLVMPGG